MNLRAAYFVLLLVGFVPLRRARAEPQAGSAASASPSSSVAAPNPPAPPPEGTLPSTPGYTEPSTPVYVPPPSAPPPYPSYAPSAYPPNTPPRDAPLTDAGPVVPPGPSPSLLRDHRYADAHVDRVVLLPTGETHPEGTLYFSSYEIVVLQAGYALSDRTQVTLTGMPPLRNETVLPFDLSLKTVLVRAPEFRVAALGSVSGISGTEIGTGVVGRAGGVVQLCLEWTCRSSVSLGSSVVLAGPAIFVGNAAGVVVYASPHISALLEVDEAIPIGTFGNEFNGIAVAPGVRFSGEHFALDIAFAHRLDVLEGPGVPFLAATYRVGTK